VSRVEWSVFRLWTVKLKKMRKKINEGCIGGSGVYIIEEIVVDRCVPSLAFKIDTCRVNVI
jgi:hypothetical protein